MNEYHEQVLELRERNSYRLEQWTDAVMSRKTLVEKYAWAIPNDEAIETLASLSPLIEIGSGNAYWAHLIREQGGTIGTYDTFEDGYDKSWTTVTPITEDALESIVSLSSAKTLFLCWPPYATDMAYRALTSFEGEYVAYVGEGLGGCTGDDAFHYELSENWTEVAQVEIPTYIGIHDRLHIYWRDAAQN